MDENGTKFTRELTVDSLDYLADLLSAQARKVHKRASSEKRDTKWLARAEMEQATATVNELGLDPAILSPAPVAVSLPDPD